MAVYFFLVNIFAAHFFATFSAPLLPCAFALIPVSVSSVASR
jgi:hypothetical protein